MSVYTTLEMARENRLRLSSELTSAVGKALLKQESVSPSAQKAAQSAAALRTAVPVASTTTNRQVTSLPNYSIYKQCYISKLHFSLDTKAFFGSLVDSATVFYDGGPLILENSEFINCEFVFSQTLQAQALLLLLTERNDPDFSYQPNLILSGFPEGEQLIKDFHRHH